MNRKHVRSLLLGASCLSAAFSGCTTPATGLLGKASQPKGIQAAANELTPSSQKKLSDPAGLHLAHARWQEKLGHVDEARKSYQVVLDGNAKSVDAIVGLARLDQMANRPQEAEHGFLKALEIAPNSALALDALGQLYATQERWDDSVKMLTAAMQAAPEEPNYRYHLAVAMAQSGNIPAARPHFIKTVGDAEAHYNIGYILQQKGDLAAAEQEFIQAVIKKPELENAQLLLDELRQQREEKLMLTGGAAPGMQQPVVQAGYSRSAHPGAAAAGVQNAAYAQLPPGASRMATLPGQAAPVGAAPRPFGQPAQAYAMPPAAPAAQWPSNSPQSNLTPQQLEQLRNQLGQ